MPITAKVRNSGAYVRAELGNIGIAKRRKPYVPIFSITPASTTEPAVGASVCASGSQVCNGKSGTFTAKPTANARKSRFAVDDERWPCTADHWVSTPVSKVNTPVERWWRYAIARMPTKRKAEPAIV